VFHFAGVPYFIAPPVALARVRFPLLPYRDPIWSGWSIFFDHLDRKMQAGA